MHLGKGIFSALAQYNRSVRRRIAGLWTYAYRVQFKLRHYRIRYGGTALVAVLLLLVSGSFYLSPVLQPALESWYATEEAIQGLQGLLLNTGSALIGAAAIVTSLVLFAMQVNIERMPHGLFRRLSEDGRLLGAFAVAFVLAMGVATLSTVIEHLVLAYVVLSAGWAVLLILLLFLYSYRRALVLINPLQQLEILVGDTRNELRTWDRRAQRAMPLLESEEDEAAGSSSSESTHDLSRTAYFQVNQHWTNGAARGVRHAMSFARRYAEHGDYEVSSGALTAIVSINAAYIEAKGKTFYADPPILDDPRSTDSIITETLEYMRQNVQIGITRRDEQQLEQSLQTMAALVGLYQRIDYSMPHASKSHAHLAAAYLADSVQAVVPHDMADVLLKGVRLMGQSAQRFILDGKPSEIATLSQKIAAIASTGCSKQDYYPVTREGMAQLATLTFNVFHPKSGCTQYAIRELRRNVAFVSELFLKVPDTPLLNNHCTNLGPYYSSTSTDSLRFRLMELVNALCDEEAGNEDAQSVIQNIKLWADGLYRPTKDLLLAAVGKRSHFSIVLTQWIGGVTEMLLVLSKAPACGRDSQKELQKHALWLIATVTWIPDDKETVTFVETFLTEALFKAGMSARSHDCEEVAKKIGEYLLSWTFKGGRYITGWGVLEPGLCACAAFALTGNYGDVDALRASIGARLQKDSAPEQDVREHAARGIRKRADQLLVRGHSSSSIDAAMSQLDHKVLRALLIEISSTLAADA